MSPVPSRSSEPGSGTVQKFALPPPPFILTVVVPQLTPQDDWVNVVVPIFVNAPNRSSVALIGAQQRILPVSYAPLAQL